MHYQYKLRRFSLSSFLLLLLIYTSAARGGQSAGLNLPLTTIDGRVTSLSEIAQGKAIYLKLWASWCQDCLAQMPHFEASHQKMNQEIQYVAVNVWLNETIAATEQVRERYNLSMPIILDKDGKLAQELGLLGTPMHVLIDSHGKLVHKGHAADAIIDEKISVLATGKLPALSNELSSEEIDIENTPLGNEGVHAVLFTATFCDWYLKESRPAVSENCSRSISFLKKASQASSDIKWKLLVSRLWTGDAELKAFTQEHGINTQVQVDTSNAQFLKNHIQTFPTLVLFKDGKELGRVSDFTNYDKALALLAIKQ